MQSGVDESGVMNSKVKIAAAAGVVGLGLAAAQLFRQSPADDDVRVAELEPTTLRLRQPVHDDSPRVTRPAPFAKPAPDPASGNSAIPLANIPALQDRSSPLDGFIALPRLPREFPAPSAYSPANSANDDPRSGGDTTVRPSPNSWPTTENPAAGSATLAAEVVRHIVIDGDTLSDLARRYLGDPARTQEILAANRGLIAHPDVLPIGALVVIPGASQE